MELTGSPQLARRTEYKEENVSLQVDHEYRIYLKRGQSIRIWLTHGSCEVFGAEMRIAKLNSNFNNNHHNNHNHNHRNNHHQKFQNKDNNNDKYSIDFSYFFQNCNISIFSYTGCELHLKYLSKSEIRKFATNSTPMHSYCNYNASLTNMRRTAEYNFISNPRNTSNTPIVLPKINAELLTNDFALYEHKILDLEIMRIISELGPRVLILGPSNSGKTSLSKILCNYGLRSDYSPLLVDLDCNLNMISLPGTIACLPISHELIDSCVSQQTHNCIDDIGRNPMIYFYGQDRIGQNGKVYSKCVEKLSLAVKKRMILNKLSRSAGLIVKCPSEMLHTQELVHRVIQLFHINVILVIDDELTLNDLKNKYSKNNDLTFIINDRKKRDLNEYWKRRFIAIEKVDKSGGVLQRKQTARANLARDCISNYFYGNAQRMFTPLSCETYPCFLRVFQIGKGHTEFNLLPADVTSVVQSYGVRQMNVDPTLRGKILAVTQIDNGIDGLVAMQIEQEIRANALYNSLVANATSTSGRGAGSMSMVDIRDSEMDENAMHIINAIVQRDPDNPRVMHSKQNGKLLSHDPFDGDAVVINKKIRSSNVMGFVHVQEVLCPDKDKSVVLKVILLNPCQQKLPNKCLLRGHINWHDR